MFHSTNYTNTLIEVSEDCAVGEGRVPPSGGERPSIARMQYDRIRQNPYRFTSDELLFAIHVLRQSIAPDQEAHAHAQFFSKGQACLRASPLVKRYGWGIHHDEQGKVALYGRETSAYRELQQRADIRKVKGMRSRRV